MREGARPGLWARLLSWLRGIFAGADRGGVPAEPLAGPWPPAEGPPPDWPGLPQGPPEHWLERLRQGGSPPMQGGRAPGGERPPAPAASGPAQRPPGSRRPPRLRRFPWLHRGRPARPPATTARPPEPVVGDPTAGGHATGEDAAAQRPPAETPARSAAFRRPPPADEGAGAAASPSAATEGRGAGLGRGARAIPPAADERAPERRSRRRRVAPPARVDPFRARTDASGRGDEERPTASDAGAPRPRRAPFRARREARAAERASRPGRVGEHPPPERDGPFRPRRTSTAAAPTGPSAEAVGSGSPPAPEGARWRAARPGRSLRSLWARLFARRRAAPDGSGGRVVAIEPPAERPPLNDDAMGRARVPPPTGFAAPDPPAAGRGMPAWASGEPAAPGAVAPAGRWPSPATRPRRGYDADVWGALPQAGADRRRRRPGRDDATQATDPLAAMWPELPPNDDSGPPTGRQIAAEETRKRWLEREQRGERWNAWPF